MEFLASWLFLLIPLLVLSPLFLLILVSSLIMGWQRSVRITHTASGAQGKAYHGYSWTYLLFGGFVPILRGEVAIGLVHFVLSLITCGLFHLVMSFLYNRQNAMRLLTQGWVLTDDEEKMAAARLRLRITAPASAPAV